MEDFLTFRKMITPVIIQIIFWVGVVAVALSAILTLRASVVSGLVMLIVGPIAVRVWCELVIIFFRMNDTLTQIRDELAKR